jgi:hypothetical protein
MKSRIEELTEKAGWTGLYTDYLSPTEKYCITVPVTNEQVIAFFNEALELAARECDKRYMGDLTREDLEAKRCAEAMRKLKV